MSDDFEDDPPIEAYDNIIPFKRPDQPPSKVFTIDELEMLPRPRSWLGDAFLAPGFRVLIAGAPKLGKSHLATQLLMTAACGGEFLGMQFNSPHSVLYLNAEIKEEYIGRRLQKALTNFSPGQQRLIRKYFHVTGRGDINLSNSRDWLRSIILEHKPSFICLDPLSQFMQGVDESGNSDMRDVFTDLINPLTDKNFLNGIDMSVVVVHHTRKDNGKDRHDFATVRGAGYFHGWFDSGLLMAPRDGAVQLNFELRNGPDIDPKLMELDRDSLQFKEFIAGDGEQRLSPTIVAMVHQMGDGEYTADEMKALLRNTAGWGVEFGTKTDPWSNYVRRELQDNADLYEIEKTGLNKGTRYRRKRTKGVH